MSHWDFSHPTDEQHDRPRRSRQADAGLSADRPGPPDLPHLPRLADLPRSTELPDRQGGAEDGVWPARDGWPTAGEWPAQGEWAADDPARDAWSAPQGWAPNSRPPSAGAWPPGGDTSPDEDWPDDGWDEGEGTAPYPLTYERDDYPTVAPQPAAPPGDDQWEPWPPAPRPEGHGDADPSGLAADHLAERARETRRIETARRGRPGSEAAPANWTGQDSGLPEADLADWADGATGRGGRRRLLPVGVAVAGAAVGAAAVLLTGGHPAAQGGQGAGGPATPPATPSAAHRPPAQGSPAQGSPAPGGASAGPTQTAPAGTGPSAATAGALTMAQAKGVLASYTTVNNGANAQHSATLLASVEAGSSYAIDAGLYRRQQAAGTAPYPAFGPVRATYYIPRDEPADGPRWFVVQVANAFNSNPDKVTSSEYLLFTQSAPGGAWQDTIEPYLLPGTDAPRIALGADGLATAVSPDATSVAVAPSQLPAATAAGLNGTGGGAGQAIADPGNLADRGDQRFWQGKIAGGTVTDTLAPAPGADGQEFALLTSDGGALVFYTDAAAVTIAAPSGSALHLDIPGFYSPDQPLPRAGVSYLDQFAAYDPPAGGGAPRVVGDYSAITGKG